MFIRKKYLLIIVLIIISAFASSCISEEQGYVITSNNKKIEGLIPMPNTRAGVGFTKVLSPDTMFPFWRIDSNGKKILVKINIGDIKFFKVREKKSNDTSLYILYQYAIWKVLYTKGDASICEHQWYEYDQNAVGPNSSINSDIGIFLNGELKWTFNGSEPSNPKKSGPFNSYLVKLINKRYHKMLTVNDFKSTDAIFEYILDRENQSIDSK